MYLLHQKELGEKYKIMKQSLIENNRRSFILINSPSSGEMFARFYELHVLENVDDAEVGKLVDKSSGRQYTYDVSSITSAKDETIDILNNMDTIMNALDKINR
jgi:hypothetical protein